MLRKNKPLHSISKIAFLTIILVMLVGIISNPDLSLNSAAQGLSTWFNILLPSLLPFLIISEILIGLGFVDFIGKLLGPIMTPLFNISGEGAFPLSMSIISGYPIGAKLTSRLREKKMITKKEGDRLICFCSTSGPSFMLGAVVIGMLNKPDLAPLILLPHYLSILFLGFVLSFFQKRKKIILIPKNNKITKEIKDSYNNFLNAKKSIGSLISVSVKESMDTMLLICGLVIFYSVLVEILFNMKFINSFISLLDHNIPLSKNLIKATITGLFEITIGCKSIASSNSSLLIKIILINFIIAWSGFSIHSQVISFLNKTDLNSGLYILSKLIHGILSSIFTYGLYLLRYKNSIIPSSITTNFQYTIFPNYNWLTIFLGSLKLVLLINFYLLLFSIILSFLFKTKKTKIN